jgi:hypothetical protein
MERVAVASCQLCTTPSQVATKLIAALGRLG